MEINGGGEEYQDVNLYIKGDNDPVDCCEIGQRVAQRGDVLEVPS